MNAMRESPVGRPTFQPQRRVFWELLLNVVSAAPKHCLPVILQPPVCQALVFSFSDQVIHVLFVPLGEAEHAVTKDLPRVVRPPPPSKRNQPHLSRKVHVRYPTKIPLTYTFLDGTPLDVNTAASCGTKNSTSLSFHLIISSSNAVRYLASCFGGNRGPCNRGVVLHVGSHIRHIRGNICVII